MKKTKQQLSVRSVSYTHDPDAFHIWFEAYVDLVKQAVLQQVSNQGCTSHTFDIGGETSEDSSLLPEFDQSSGAFRRHAKDDGIQNGTRQTARD